MLPHVRRKNREQVARFLIEDKYSQFSEAVAGLRNLLDSPRYEALSRCLPLRPDPRPHHVAQQELIHPRR